MKTLLVLLLLLQALARHGTRHRLRRRRTTKPQTLEVHVFPHSHMDLAWLDPFEHNYQNEAKPVYLSVLQALRQDAQRKFVFAESAFLQKFMEDRQVDAQIKAELKGLVKEGRVELVNGGLAANDHATTYYEDTIDQMTYGHQFIKNTFGVEVEAGWNVDTFGGSIVDNYLSEKMGMRNIFLSRLNKIEKEKRMKEGSMTMVMDTDKLDHLGRGSSFLQVSNVLLSMSSLHYGFPESFCIDSTCQKTWKNKDFIDNTNLEQKAQAFTQLMNQSAQGHRNKHLLFFMLGDDFAYKEADSTFKQFEVLMDHINSNKDSYHLSLVYSTPQEYFKRLEQQNRVHNHLVDTQPKDFFPYSDNTDEVWTGFYSSRPVLKYKIRQAGRYLQSTRTFFGLMAWTQQERWTGLLSLEEQKQANATRAQVQAIDRLERAMGLCQHHDAVTGTSKSFVQSTYKQALYSGVNATQQQFLRSLDSISSLSLNLSSSQYMVFNCDHTDHYYLDCPDVYQHIQEYQTGLILAIYNPTYERTLIMKMKIPPVHLSLYDIRSNSSLVTDIFCDVLSPEFCEIHFQVRLTTLGMTFLQTSFASPSQNKLDFQVKQQVLKTGQNKNITYKLTGDSLSVSLLNGSLGLLLNGKSLSFKYQTISNDDRGGAYLFSPQDDSPLADQSFQYIQIFKGKLLTLLRCQDKEHLVSLVKFFPHRVANSFQDNLIEINSMVLEPPANTEMFLTISQDGLDNQGIFYTDANGLSLQKRERPPRLRDSLYPVTKIIAIKDSKASQQMMVVTDRTQAGSSLEDGSISLLIQRQTLSDDHKGLEEKLEDDEMIFTTHYVVLGPEEEQRTREIQLHTDTPPLLNYLRLEDNAQVDFIDNATQVGKMVSLEENVKIWVVFDRWHASLPTNQWAWRIQNFNLGCRALVDIKGAKVAQEMGLDYIKDKHTLDYQQDALPWIHAQQHPMSWRPRTFGVQLAMEQGLDISTYLLERRTQ